MSRRPDAPSLGVVAVGGIGVLVVVAFVVALSLGSSTRRAPGELVRVVVDDGPGGMAVLAGRCLDERVRSVTVSQPDGTVLWRIVSRKGSIDRRYPVGAGAPLGFEVEHPLAARPSGSVRAEVVFTEDREEHADARTVHVDDLPAEGSTLESGPPACGDDEGPGFTTVAFAVAAAFVLAGYGLMLLRFRRRG